MRAPVGRLLFKLALLCTFLLVACKPYHENESTISIVGGVMVDANSTGPERLSTVGLNGCTGTIIARDLILTAAHCHNTALSGGYVLFGNNFMADRQIIQIAGSRVKANRSGASDDIALLRLATPIPSEYQPVELFPPEAAIFRGNSVRLAGYGSDNTPQSFGVLRTVVSSIVDRREDGAIFVQSGESAACVGDSGGPLLIFRDGHWYTAGIASTAIIRDGRCIGGNYYSPIQENYETIWKMAQELTERANPFNHNIPPESGPAPIINSVEFSLNRRSVQEGRQTLSVEVTNLSPGNVADCEFTLRVSRVLLIISTRYTIKTTLDELAQGETIRLEFQDLANLRRNLGQIRDLDLEYRCAQAG